MSPGYTLKLQPAPGASSSGPLCSDDSSVCSYLSDDACDDGGTGSQYDDCPFGTDCTDCGPRAGGTAIATPNDLDLIPHVCTSCPVECNQVGVALKNPFNQGPQLNAGGCLESMWNTGDQGLAVGACNPQCNTWQCGHDGGDCSLTQILDACRPDMESDAARLLSTPGPGGIAPVEFILHEMDPFRVALDDSTNQWAVEVQMKIGLRWSDPRLKTAACVRVLNQMLTLVAGASNADRLARELDRQLIWTPPLKLNGSAFTYIADSSGAAPGAVKNELKSSEFTYFGAANGSNPWIGRGPTNIVSGGTASTVCTDCAALNMSFTWSVGTVPNLEFKQYPFDEQTFRLRFDFGKHAHAFSCDALNTDPRSLLAIKRSANDLQSLLPSTNEYLLKTATSAYFEQPTDPVLGAVLHQCDLVFEVTRDDSIVFAKVLIPTIIIVYIGMSSVFLSAADHSGDRAALLGVSILISMINLERDLGLGMLTYAMWFDTFNMFQLYVQLVALLEGYIEHKLVCTGREAECLMLNKVWTVYSLGLAYPLLTMAILVNGGMWGGSEGLAAALYAIVAVGAVFSVFAFRRLLQRDEKKRQYLAKKLSQIDPTSQEFEPVFKEAFEAHDLDASGGLDSEELRTLIKAVFGKNRDVFASAMDLARSIGSATGGTLSVDACMDLFYKLESQGTSSQTRRVGMQRQKTVALKQRSKSFGASMKNMFGGSRKNVEPKIEPATETVTTYP